MTNSLLSKVDHQYVAIDRPLYTHHELLNAVVDLANSTERMVDVYIALLRRDEEVQFWNRGGALDSEDSAEFRRSRPFTYHRECDSRATHWR